MFRSLGYRLRSRVALGIGIVVIIYCKFLMEYVHKEIIKVQQSICYKLHAFSFEKFLSTFQHSTRVS